MRRTELFEVIKEDIIRHEGYIREIYLCSEGHPTFGVGHLVTPDDMEHSWPVGTPVTEERIESVFQEDFLDALEDAESLVESLYDKPDDVIRVVVNMAFNIGRSRLRQFKKMLRAIESNKFEKAANEMVDSKWYHQVGRRSKELEELMRSV